MICVALSLLLLLPRSLLLDIHASGSHERRRLLLCRKIAVQLLPQGGLLWPRCEPRDVLEWAVLEYVRSVHRSGVTGTHLPLCYFHLIVHMCPHPVMAGIHWSVTSACVHRVGFE